MGPAEFRKQLATRNHFSRRPPIPLSRALDCLENLRDDRTLFFLGGCGLVKTKGLFAWVRTPEGDTLLKELRNE